MADQYYMHSAARVNQFEMKDACFEFSINVSREVNNVKIEFKNKFVEITVLIVYEINDKTPEKQLPAILFKKILWHRCFSVNFANFLITPFLQNTSGQLLLKPGLCLVLSRHIPCERTNLKCFGKKPTVKYSQLFLRKSFILDVSLCSEYISDYNIWIRLYFLLFLPLLITKVQKQSFTVVH